MSFELFSQTCIYFLCLTCPKKMIYDGVIGISLFSRTVFISTVIKCLTTMLRVLQNVKLVFKIDTQDYTCQRRRPRINRNELCLAQVEWKLDKKWNTRSKIIIVLWWTGGNEPIFKTIIFDCLSYNFIILKLVKLVNDPKHL